MTNIENLGNDNSVNQIYQHNYREILNLIHHLPGIAYRCFPNPNSQEINILFLSEGCENLTGYKSQELIKQCQDNYYNLIYPDDLKRIKNELAQQLAQQSDYELEYRIVTIRNEIKWVLDRGRLLQAQEQKNLEYLEGFITDITQQKKAEKEISLLYDLASDITSADNLDQAFQLTLAKIEEITYWNYGEVWLPNQEQTKLVYHLAWYNPHIPPEMASLLEEFKRKSYHYSYELNVGLPGKVWYKKGTKWIKDVSQDQSFTRKELAIKCGLKTAFAVPILAHNEVVAVLVFFMTQVVAIDEKLTYLINFMAHQLGKFIQRKQIEEALRQAEANYRGIVENALEGIFQTTIDGQYLSTNPALARIYGYNSSEELIKSLTDIKSQLYVNQDQRKKFIELLRENEVISNFESQVYRQDGSIIWISENARAVKDDAGNILYYEGTVEDITERKRIKETLHFQAFYDALTNLPNRAFLMKKLHFLLDKCRNDYIKNVENPFQFAILFLDLDRFKLINDSLGHLIGDKLLIEIAARLGHCVRNTDTVSRLGGDEFTIILEEVESLDQAISIAQRIIETINQPFEIEGNLIYTGTSIGVWFSEKAYFLMDQSTNALDNFINQSESKVDLIYVKKPEDLLKDADSALYEAKASGKGNYKIFDQSMKKNALEILELEVDLRQAWSNQNFELYYQPIYDLVEEKIVSLEVFLRWNHPVKGLISAEKFIKILEESNLIIMVEDWVLRTALNQLEIWSRLPYFQEENNPLFKLHINLSKKYFLQPNFTQKLDHIFSKYPDFISYICLEMNQNYELNHNHGNLTNNPLGKVEYLSCKGIELCLEDFGTKNSSLNNLYQLPIQAIKVDPDFISNYDQNPKKEKIARGIFSLAQSLNIQAIARGIETEEQLEKLEKLNCQFAQGYYFSHPLNAQQVEEILISEPYSFHGSNKSARIKSDHLN